MGFVEVETRVVPASVYGVSKFSRKSLNDYARLLGINPKEYRTKLDLSKVICNTGKATYCASLGN